MSLNSDDVLDDWEEIDEVSLNSKLDKLKKESAKMNTSSPQSSVQQQQQHHQQNGKQQPIKMVLMHHDDDYRTQYGPAEPTVKILKRPTLNSTNKSILDTKPKAPMKTLQQREHEYAQARLRIMGSAQSPEDNTDIFCRQNGVINNIRNSTPTICGQTTTVTQQPASSYTLSNGTLTADIQTQMQEQQQRPQDGVIRLPRGPNGTTGFMIRR